MDKERLRLVYRPSCLPAEVSVARVESVMTSHGVAPQDFELDGAPVELGDVAGRIRRRNLQHYGLTGNGFEFDHGLVGTFDLESFWIECGAPAAIKWDTWAGEFVGMNGFVMSWIADVEFELWQNAEDPLEYASVGRPYKHLPMKSNGLPYPVEKMIIDTSTNPGRRVLRQGYIEVVGHVMWLGEPFWSLTGAIKDDVVRANWLRVTTSAPGVLRVQAADHPFTTDEGESGELQRKLRRLLFPKSAKRR